MSVALGLILLTIFLQYWFYFVDNLILIVTFLTLFYLLHPFLPRFGNFDGWGEYRRQKEIAPSRTLFSRIKESKFRETGVLTPEEFVAAGEHLVHHCPTWQWARGEEARARPYLPPDRQFLVTRNVPCYRRCKQMEHCEDKEKVIEEDGGGGGWVDTHHYDTAGRVALEEKVCEMTLEAAETGDGAAARAAGAGGGSDEDDDDDDDEGEAEDMENFQESGLLDEVDPSTALAPRAAPPPAAGAGAGAGAAAADGDDIVRTRTYDLHITYDKYYQTPRLWLIGYDENHKLLSVEQMYEDVSAEHAHKTVTMETHPHLAGPSMASVHPCRHAEVMKKIMETVTASGGELGVHAYLIVFLKFVQSVIPTIEYDFTQNFSIQ